MMSINKEKPISIALCTYNGLPFLSEQLKSIAGQTILPLELIVLDDASTDLTVQEICEFSKQAPFTVTLYENKERLGPIQNFSQAINACQGHYIALCDQDDFWLPNRLELTFQAMKVAEEKFGSHVPLLVHTDLAVVDAAGKSIAPSFMNLSRIRHCAEKPLSKLIAQNFVTGNTILINRPLAKAALPIPAEAAMHDWWLALVAAAVGRIIFIDQPTVLYRQHKTNLIGAGGFFTLRNMKRLLDINNMNKELAATLKQAAALNNILAKKNDCTIPAWLPDLLEEIMQNRLQAVKATARYGVKKQGFIRNIIFKILLFMGGYLTYLR
jgi:glycosyltransferase involved in cell wall biosynthesis